MGTEEGSGPTPGAEAEVPADPLSIQRRAWERRPLVRSLYHEWFERIVRALADAPGPTVELGCGIGAFKEFHRAVVATDVAPSPWAEDVVDAERLPYAPGSVANLVLVDVFHHLPHPLRFLDEATRALAPGGRVVMLEPYCSPISTRAYRRFHHERTDPSVDPFAGAQSGEDPWDSNQALATLFFWRGLDRYRARYPRLRLVTRERFSLLAYPLSGGFTGRPLAPTRAGERIRRAERFLAAVAPFGAFRCLVVLQRD